MRNDIGNWAVGVVGDPAAMLKPFRANRPGMLKIGTRAVRSLHEEKGDMHQPGARCTIVGVVPREWLTIPKFTGAYFVIWDDVKEQQAIGFVIAEKLVAAP